MPVFSDLVRLYTRTVTVEKSQIFIYFSPVNDQWSWWWSQTLIVNGTTLGHFTPDGWEIFGLLLLSSLFTETSAVVPGVEHWYFTLPPCLSALACIEFLPRVQPAVFAVLVVAVIFWPGPGQARHCYKTANTFTYLLIAAWELNFSSRESPHISVTFLSLCVPSVVHWQHCVLTPSFPKISTLEQPAGVSVVVVYQWLNSQSRLRGPARPLILEYHDLTTLSPFPKCVENCRYGLAPYAHICLTTLRAGCGLTGSPTLCRYLTLRDSRRNPGKSKWRNRHRRASPADNYWRLLVIGRQTPARPSSHCGSWNVKMVEG